MADAPESPTVPFARAGLGELAGRLAGCDPAGLIDPLRADQAARWRAGDGLPVEDYLAAFPALRQRTEDLLVLIWGEVLLRAERGAFPEPAEYQRRFPDLAEALALQFELERGLNVTTTLPAAPTLAPARTAEAEVRDLLRSRLRALTAICFVLTAVYAVLYVTLVPADQFGIMPPLYALVLVVTGSLYGLLGSRRPRTTAWLRWAELVNLAALVVFSTGLQFLIYDRWAGPFPAGDWNGSLMYARSVDFNWVIFVIGYGLLIPNTRRRATAIILVLAGWPVLLNAVWAVPGGSAWDRGTITLASSVNLSMAAALALFGARRFEALREQAARARRLGPYHLKSRLGSGSMGEVWLAEHVLLRRPCAVKLIRPEHVGDSRFLRRFEREVRATTR